MFIYICYTKRKKKHLCKLILIEINWNSFKNWQIIDYLYLSLYHHIYNKACHTKSFNYNHCFKYNQHDGDSDHCLVPSIYLFSLLCATIKLQTLQVSLWSFCESWRFKLNSSSQFIDPGRTKTNKAVLMIWSDRPQSHNALQSISAHRTVSFYWSCIKCLLAPSPDILQNNVRTVCSLNATEKIPNERRKHHTKSEICHMWYKHEIWSCLFQSDVNIK